MAKMALALAGFGVFWIFRRLRSREDDSIATERPVDLDASLENGFPEHFSIPKQMKVLQSKTLQPLPRTEPIQRSGTVRWLAVSVAGCGIPAPEVVDSQQ
jgi:hypothetical protein